MSLSYKFSCQGHTKLESLNLNFPPVEINNFKTQVLGSNELVAKSYFDCQLGDNQW
jgi:hypothetical protein